MPPAWHVIASSSSLVAISASQAGFAQKPGGVLRVHAGDSPPSMSMHEEVDAVPARASAFSWPSSSRDLSSSSRAHPGFMHAVSLFLVAIAVVLLMAPAAYHRIVYAGEVSEDMHRVGSALVTAATVPLALGLAGDVCVVITKIAGSQLPGWWRQPGARFPKSGFSVRARTGSAARHADPPASRLSVLGRRKCRPGDRPPQGWLHC